MKIVDMANRGSGPCTMGSLEITDWIDTSKKNESMYGGDAFRFRGNK